MKLEFLKDDKKNILDCLSEPDFIKLVAFTADFPQAKRMEIIIREWRPRDINRMRNYFEGPAKDFVLLKTNNKRIEENKPILNLIDIREGLKALFIGVTDGIGDLKIAISTKTLDYEGWKRFLKNIDNYCIENFGLGLPEEEE